MNLLDKRLYGAAALAVGLATGACGGGEDEAATDTGTTEETAQGADARTVEMETQDFAFAPAELTAPAGAKMTVKLRNTGAAPHTFTVSSLGVDERVEAGENGEASFTMPDSGSVTFVCTLHEARGMKGTINQA